MWHGVPPQNLIHTNSLVDSSAWRCLPSWREPTSGAVPVARSEQRTRTSLLLEPIALRHQISVLERSRTRRPCFRGFDRLFWILLSRWWSDWRERLLVRRFTKQFVVLFSETTEVPEVELECNIGHRGRVRTSPPQSTTGVIQVDAPEIRGRAHAERSLERAINRSSRQLVSSAEFGHRRADHARSPHILINLAHHSSGPFSANFARIGKFNQ